MKNLLLAIVFIGLLNFNYAQVEPDSSQLVSLQSLNSKYNQKFSVHWSKDTGTPEITTFSTPLQFDRIRINSVNQFIHSLQGILKYRANKDSLVLGEIRENKGNTYYNYEQTYKKIKVLGGNYVITVLSDGYIKTVLGRFFKDINIRTKPQLTIDEAYKNARSEPPRAIQLKDTLINSQLIIYPEHGNYHLTWELKIPTIQNEGVLSYYVDAISGKILNKKNSVIYEVMQPQSKLYAYSRHPGLDANYSYYTPIAHLYSSTHKLQGTYTYVYNDAGSEAYNYLNDFRYPTSSAHFDEANLYYHIDRFRSNFWNSLGFNKFSQIKAHANTYFSSGPNAGYDPSDHHLRFSNGQGVSGYNSFAREDKIIYHEYTHAVTDYVAHLLYGYNESGAIHEGNSDYFAATFTSRKIIGEYSSDGHSINQRDISNPRIKNYTEYQDLSSYLGYPFHEPHFGGELWSATLWDLRNSNVGQYYSDRLIYNGLFALPTNPTFLQYRQSIIDWDNNYYGGNHVSKIIHAFYLRGIGADNISVYISGPGNLDYKQIGTWSANVSGGSSSRTYKWYKSSDGTNWGSVLGTSSTFSTTMLYDDFHLRCIVSDSQTEEEASATKIVYSEILPKQASQNEDQLEIPKEYGLSSNYPNPFNPSTTIKYKLKEPGLVSLIVYDVLGKEVAELVNNYKNEGFYKATFNAKEFSSGIYFYTMRVNDFVSSKKMLLAK